MVERAATVWADGPASSPYEPKKPQIRQWGTWVETMIDAGGLGGATWKATRALLIADLAHPAGSLGVVHDDPTSANSGLYTKSGASGSGSWSQITTFLPGYQFVTATDDGESTANAYSMDTNPRLPAGDGVALVEFVVPSTNTSETVTISFDGEGALRLKTASGNDPAVGGLIEGMPVSGVKIVDKFYMRSDQASAAVQAAVEAAQGYAKEWAQSDEPISEGAGGDGDTDRSAKYWAAQAVGINWTGDYGPATSYSLNDGVAYGGSSWRYVSETSSSGNAPPAPPSTSNAWWRLVAGGGANGAPGGGLKGIGCTVVDQRGNNPATDYEEGDIVSGQTLLFGDVILRATPGGDPLDGIYVVEPFGGAIRHPDFDTWDQVYGGLFPVADGSMWQNANGPGGVISTTPLIFSDISTTGEFSDAMFRITNNVDATKELAFQLSGLSPASTRTITMGDSDVTLRPQALEEIAKGSITSLAALDFTNLGAFRYLSLKGKFYSGADAVNLQLRTSSNNGGSYDTGDSQYVIQTDTIEGAVRNGALLNGASGLAYYLTYGGAVGSSPNESISFSLEIFDFNKAEYCFIQSEALFISSAGTFIKASNGGCRSQAVARNALRLLFSSGVIARGFYVLEGVRG